MTSKYAAALTGRPVKTEEPGQSATIKKRGGQQFLLRSGLLSWRQK
jgi:hypothetical protein